MYKRNFRLYTPPDFDYSPYFEIIKYPLLGLNDLAVYRQLPWDQDGVICNDENDCYIPNAHGNSRTRTPAKPVIDNIIKVDDSVTDNDVVDAEFPDALTHKSQHSN